ncbi:MAG TPA: hypothetical protein VEG38_00530 [Acidimicrobiia bacterium]|nr:hypothetical protein [Acidimicrobiia bacterium]
MAARGAALAETHAALRWLARFPQHANVPAGGGGHVPGLLGPNREPHTFANVLAALRSYADPPAPTPPPVLRTKQAPDKPIANLRP